MKRIAITLTVLAACFASLPSISEAACGKSGREIGRGAANLGRGVARLVLRPFARRNR